MRCAALYRRPPILRGVSASQIRADHAANQERINARYGPALPSSPQLETQIQSFLRAATATGIPILQSEKASLRAGVAHGQVLRPIQQRSDELRGVFMFIFINE